MKLEQKIDAFRKIVERQDLGDASVTKAERSILTGDDKGTNLGADFLTRYLINSIMHADSVDDIESDLRYAIDQLNKAVNQIVYLK